MKRSFGALEVLGSHLVKPGKRPRPNNRNYGTGLWFKNKPVKIIFLKSGSLDDITREKYPHLEVLNLEQFEGLKPIFEEEDADKGMELLSTLKKNNTFKTKSTYTTRRTSCA